MLGDQCRRFEGRRCRVRAVWRYSVGKFCLFCQWASIQVKELSSRKSQRLFRPCPAHSLRPAEPAPIARLLFALPLIRHLRYRPDTISPIKKLLFRTGKRADVLKPRLDDRHGNALDIKQIVIGVQGAQRIQHHLRVVVGIHEHAASCFEITDMQDAGSQDHHISGAEAAGGDVAVIQPFLYQRQYGKPLRFHPFNRGDHEFGVDVGQALNLLCQILRLWTLHAPVKILLYFVLTQLMRPCSFLRIGGSLIRKVLLQPCGWRAVQPPL